MVAWTVLALRPGPLRSIDCLATWSITLQQVKGQPAIASANLWPLNPVLNEMAEWKARLLHFVRNGLEKADDGVHIE